MKIIITSGVGEGSTPLAAFDHALYNSGVANYNLIALSSIIPPASDILRARYVTPDEDYGKRLYVVMAREHAEAAGTYAWAGIGWCQNSMTKKGLFVEHHGTDRGDLEANIHATLQDMIAIRGEIYDTLDYEIVSKQCVDKPVCAIVLAVYKTEPWEL